MSREAMRMALELIEPIAHNSTDDPRGKAYEAITALRQALETEQEPCEFWSVAEGWVKIDEVREHFDAVGCGTIYKSAGEGRSPLYTAPQKQWVGLTADEIWKCNRSEAGNAVEFHICSAHQNVMDFAEAIEAKLREKNT
jgi:hypothetical protein